MATAKLGPRERRIFNETLKAARIGVLESQYEVGLMYASGNGVTPDLAQAAQWIGRAAERGMAGAQYLLGTRYANGIGGEKNEHLAVAWFHKAAEQGNAKAMLRLGRLYGAARPEAALRALEQAADLGLAEAQQALGAALADGPAALRDEVRAVHWLAKAAAQ